MTGRDRMRAAMSRQTPDRVPVMCQLALGHYFLHSDRKPSDIWFDSATFAATLADFARRYRFDGLLINLPGRPGNWRDYLASYEQTDAGETLHWSFDLHTRIPPDDNAHTFAPGDKSLSRADYTNVDPDDPATYRIPGYVWNTWHAPTLWDIAPDADLAHVDAYPDWFTAPLRAARQANADLSVHQEVFSPFTHLLELFSYESALMALLDEPDMCRRLLDIFTAQVCAQVEAIGRCDPDAILISSAFAGAGFISRDMYGDFVVPYERQVVDAIHAFDIPSYVHTCGAIGDRLDLMADTGVAGIDTLDPPPLGTVDLAKAKAAFGERFFFKGNLDAVNEMLRADDATFDKAVRRRLDIGKPGGGYILSSACSVAPGVDPKRLSHMVDLAEQCGRYD
jgi:uroporphyrinogen-III decarboxylase